MMRALTNKTLAMLGGWVLLGGALPALAQQECAVPDCAGIALSATYDGDVRSNTTGGLKTGTAYSCSRSVPIGAPTTCSATRASRAVPPSCVGGGKISGERSAGPQQHRGGRRLAPVRGVDRFAPAARRTPRCAPAYSISMPSSTRPRPSVCLSPHGVGTELSQTGSAGLRSGRSPVLARAAGGYCGLAWRFGVYDGAPGSADGSGFLICTSPRGRARCSSASLRIHPSAQQDCAGCLGIQRRRSTASTRTC